MSHPDWYPITQVTEAEVSLLNACFERKENYWDTASVLKGEQFSCTDYEILFDAIGDMYKAVSVPDPAILSSKLGDRQELAQILLYELYNADHCFEYAEIVKYAWRGRQVDLICSNVDSSKPDETIERVVTDLSSLNAVASSSIDGETMYDDAITRYLSPNMQDKALKGIRTGIDVIDEHWGLLAAGTLNVIAARTGVGKTALAISIIHSVLKQDLGVCFFSLEMPKEEIADRLISLQTGIPVFKLREGCISRAGGAKIANIQRPRHLRVDDEPAITSTKLLARASRMAATDKLDLVVVDYLQLMGGVAENRRETVAGNARTLKVLAKQLKVPVIALAQLNRNPDYREGGRPRLSDLKESGEIEQSADTVSLITREDTRATIYLAKNRHGSLAEFDMTFVPSTTEFKNKSSWDEETV